MNAPSGWYGDPANPGAERFWDGTQWTEHTRAPAAPPPPVSPPLIPQPPFGQRAAWTDSATSARTRHPGGKLNEIGDWLNRSFAATLEQAGPLTIFFLAPFAVFAVAYLIGHLSVQNVVISNDAIDGVNVGLAVVALLVLTVTAVVATATYLATHHQLYGAIVGRPPGWSASFSVGFKRLPIFVGIMFAVSLAVAIPLGLVAVLLVVADAVVLLLLLIPVVIVVTVWTTVKLSLITVAVAVAPAGTSGLSAGWRSTDGFFWAILGRIMLMGIVVNVLLFIQQMLGGVLWPMAFGSQLAFDQQDELLINGQRASTLDAVVVGDVLPNPVTMLLVIGVLFYVQFMVQAVSFAGNAALYADTGGANAFDHR